MVSTSGSTLRVVRRCSRCEFDFPNEYSFCPYCGLELGHFLKFR